MNKYLFNTFAILLLLIPPITAQELSSLKEYFGNGLTINSGINFLAVKDEFISKERYTGHSPSFLLDWTRISDSSGFHLSFGVISSAKINNYNISADITEASLNLSYVYPIGDIKIFNLNSRLFLGPAPELFFHFRTQDIARGAIIDAYSAAFLFSAGVRLDVIMPVNNKWLVEGNIYSSLLSLGGKFIDPRDNNTSMMKILTAFTGVSSYLNLAVRYHLIKNISLKAGYKFSFIRLSAWDYFILAKDDFNLSLTYSL